MHPCPPLLSLPALVLPLGQPKVVGRGAPAEEAPASTKISKQTARPYSPDVLPPFAGGINALLWS